MRVFLTEEEAKLILMILDYASNLMHDKYPKIIKRLIKRLEISIELNKNEMEGAINAQQFSID